MPNHDVRALIVHPDGREDRCSINPTLAALQAVVGGYIEHVTVTPKVHAYVNEEGLLQGLPYNQEASLVTGRHLVGPVIFLGSTPDGDEADLPEEWL